LTSNAVRKSVMTILSGAHTLPGTVTVDGEEWAAGIRDMTAR
jgi:hypothetical protein